MLNLIPSLLASSQTTDISPELREAQPWLDGVVSVSDGMMNTGIDPSLALATIAAVPIVLKVLNMINQFTAAAIEDWKEANMIRRDKERFELQLMQDRASKGLPPLPPPAPVQPSVPSPGPIPRHPPGRRPTG